MVFSSILSRISLQATTSRKAATPTRLAQFPVNMLDGGHSQRFESAAGTAESPPGPTQPQKAVSTCPHPPSSRTQTTLFGPEGVRERCTPGPAPFSCDTVGHDIFPIVLWAPWEWGHAPKVTY